MEKKRLLFVTQELDPYTGVSEISAMVAKMPKFLQDKDLELRILMPRYGTINERRHRLHEVVRLSGMNIIVDDDDYPLIIKVASLPGSRLQVYFMDNEDFFKRKSVFSDDSGQPFEDNPERAIFFCKGVIETVKKFGWAPDIISCHGFLTGLLPFYIKEAYKTEPLFANAQIVYHAYDSEYESMGAQAFFDKANINNLTKSELEPYRTEDGGLSMHQGACFYSDAVVLGSENFNSAVDFNAIAAEKPVLPYDGENYLRSCLDFFHTLVEMEEEVLA